MIYLVTGLYELLKANFWVVELPIIWYTFTRVLYFPFSPYHNFVRQTLLDSPISYEQFTYIMWGPLVGNVPRRVSSAQFALPSSAPKQALRS